MEIQKHITSGNFLQFALEHGQSKEKKSVWIHSYLLTMVMFQSKLFNCQGLVSLTYLFIYISILQTTRPDPPVAGVGLPMPKGTAMATSSSRLVNLEMGLKDALHLVNSVIWRI